MNKTAAVVPFIFLGLMACVSTPTEPDPAGESTQQVQQAAKRCKAPLSTCGPTCVDLKTDYFNCGTCANQCQNNQVCSAGACTCAAGQTKCAGVCVDTSSNNANCGGCGIACGTGTTCQAGSCQPVICTPSCFEGLCGGPDGCGGTCGCSSGTCNTASGVCEGGATDCTPDHPYYPNC